MEGIIGIVVLFFILNAVFKLFKRIAQPAKGNETQAEAAKYKPVPKPAAKPADYRFPTVRKSEPAPVQQEGRDPGLVLSEYTPISSSLDLQRQFSDYQGSLVGTSAEGEGYKSEAYEPVEVPYRTDAHVVTRVLPETLNREAFLQAVVMSEILRRPGARR